MDLRAALKALNLQLPGVPKPAAIYIPLRQTGHLLFVSGQVCMRDGKPIMTGPVPSKVSIEDGQRAAQQCVLNGLAVIDQHLGGDWSRLVNFVRLGVFVQSDSDFDQQHIVANGASGLLEKLFGAQGLHARTAIGTNALPLNVTVEVEMIVEIK
jgi:enamine deaminase RidA (YjgF/YER057c/UK114 family)